MLYRSLVGLLFLLVLSEKIAFSQENFLNLERLDNRDGLSNNQVKCFLRDRYGFLWVGTRDGLNRYNGYSFEIYRPNPTNPFALLEAEIYCLLEDKQGTVWVGMQIDGLARYDRQQDRFINLAKDSVLGSFFQGKDVYAITEDKEENIWIGTQKGLLRFDKGRKKIAIFLEKENISSLLLDKNGNLWIGTKENGLYGYNPKKQIFENYQSNHQFPAFCAKEISSISENAMGDLVLGTQQGVIFGKKLNNQIVDFQCFNPIKNEPKSLKVSKNTFVWHDSQGNLWTTDNSLSGITVISYHKENEKIIFDKVKQYLHDPLNPQSLASNRVREIYADRSGIVWIGTEEGIDYFSPKRNQFDHLYNYLMLDSKGLNNNEVRAVYEDENGKLWISTYGGGINFCDLPTGECEAITLEKNQKTLSKGRQLCKGTDNLLWSATSGGGMYAIDMRTQKIVFNFQKNESNPQSLIDNDIGALYEDSQKTLWIGTEEGLCKIAYKNRKKGIFEDLRTWTKEKLNTIIEDNEGNLWIATETKGLIRVRKDGTEKTVFQHDPQNPNSLPQNNVRTMYQDDRGRIWAGTGLGLSLYVPEKQNFTNFGQNIGFTNTVVNGILAEGDWVWVSTNDGIFRLNLPTKNIQHFTPSEGLQGKEFRKRSFHKGKSGKFYFGGLNGLNYFDPKKIQIDTTKNRVVLTDFRLFNKSVPIRKETVLKENINLIKEIELSYQDYVFSIHFSALDFHNPEKILYAYRLSNFETEWNYVGANQRMATYTNLDAGTYFFEVKATNTDGIWNESPTVLKLRVKPPFWKTTWFILSMLVSIVGTSIGFYQYRIRQIGRQKEKLEEIVTIRTAELAQEKKEIEKKNIILEEQTQEIGLKNIELQQTQEEMVAQRDFITDKNVQLNTTLQELERKNKHITDSIRYAQTIQQAILPNLQKLERYLGNYFILFRPKDMVSGDFYWITYINPDHYLLALADCTGHGVPGGFMSMIAYSLLNDIVKQKKILDPTTILYELNQRWHEALMTEQNRAEDGMDVGICSIERKESHTRLIFGGARIPLWYIENNEIHEIAATRKSIGSPLDTGRRFESHQIEVTRGTCVYMSSDGLIDQSDELRRKFGRKKLLDFLLNHYQKPFELQKQDLETVLDTYQAQADQRDDITVWGFRV